MTKDNASSEHQTAATDDDIMWPAGCAFQLFLNRCLVDVRLNNSTQSTFIISYITDALSNNDNDRKQNVLCKTSRIQIPFFILPLSRQVILGEVTSEMALEKAKRKEFEARSCEFNRAVRVIKRIADGNFGAGGHELSEQNIAQIISIDFNYKEKIWF